MILAHNHPSSDASPSEADVQLTQRMSEAGRLVGIPVLDHIVVGGDEATSLAALGMMPKGEGRRL
jgi:DNA repair protein RadC